MKKLFSCLTSLLVSTSLATAQTTPQSFQAQVNAIPWTNGQNKVTGQNLNDLFSTVTTIFSGMGSWDSSGTFTPRIGGFPPAPSATIDTTSATNIKYTPPFVSPSTQTLAQELANTRLLTDYAGADPTGANFSDAALASAFSDLRTNCGTLIIPRSVAWKFSANAVFNFPASSCSVQIRGDGGATRLNWPAASGGLTFNYNHQQNALKVTDMSLATGAVNGGEAIRLYRTGNFPTATYVPINEIYNVSFKNTSENLSTSAYWSKEVGIHGVINTVVDGSVFAGTLTSGQTNVGNGTGISFEGTGRSVDGGAQYGIIATVKNSYFEGLACPLNYDSWFQGVTVESNNFGYNTHALCTPAPTGSDGTASQLYMSHNQGSAFGGTLFDVKIPIFEIHSSGNSYYVSASQIGWNMATTVPFFINDTFYGPAVALWAPSTAYATVGSLINNNMLTYQLTTAGTSAASGGPTGTGSSIADGSAVWSYVGPGAVALRFGPSPVSGGVFSGSRVRGFTKGLDLLASSSGIQVVGGTQFSNNEQDVADAGARNYFDQSTTWSDGQAVTTNDGASHLVGSHNSPILVGPVGSSNTANSQTLDFYSRSGAGVLQHGYIFEDSAGTTHVRSSGLIAFEGSQLITGVAPPNYNTYSTPYNGFLVNIGGLPSTTFPAAGTGGSTGAVVGAVDIPAGQVNANAYQGSGIVGLARTATSSMQAVGVFGAGFANVDNAQAWGFNSVSTNNPDFTPISNRGFNNFNVYGWEADFRITAKSDGTAPGGNLVGIDLVGNSDINPLGMVYGEWIQPHGLYTTPVTPWKEAWHSDDGAATMGFNIGSNQAPKSGLLTGSQAIQFRSYNSLSPGIYTLSTDPYGDLVMQPATLGAGTVLNDTNGTMAFQTSDTVDRVGKPLMLKSYTVATLPTCGASLKSAMAAVTDATAPTYNGALTGGGTVGIPVFCDGSAWSAH